MAPGSTVNYDVKSHILTLSMEDDNIQSLYDRWDAFRRATSRVLENTLSEVYRKLREQNQDQLRYVPEGAVYNPPAPAPPAVPDYNNAVYNYDGQPADNALAREIRRANELFRAR